MLSYSDSSQPKPLHFPSLWVLSALYRNLRLLPAKVSDGGLEEPSFQVALSCAARLVDVATAPKREQWFLLPTTGLKP